MNSHSPTRPLGAEAQACATHVYTVRIPPRASVLFCHPLSMVSTRDKVHHDPRYRVQQTSPCMRAKIPPNIDGNLRSYHSTCTQPGWAPHLATVTATPPPFVNGSTVCMTPLPKVRSPTKVARSFSLWEGKPTRNRSNGRGREGGKMADRTLCWVSI